MQVPEHVVSLYVATCGQHGPGLGSDEKEIILLVYVILEAATGQIIGTKQLLVRPDGSFVKDRTISTSSEHSNAGSSPPLAINYTDVNGINNNNINNNNNNNINNNNNNNNNNSNATCCSSNMITNSSSVVNNNNNNIITNGPTSQIDNIELPIAIAQAAGKPLNEAIKEFDEYLRSLLLNDANNINLITDGQLPLRQCLHREACAKDVDLPVYYNRFSDLRKEFLMFKSGDLTRALVPVKDIKKILQTPPTQPPQSIGEMMKDLNIGSIEDAEFYVRESRDMVSVIQHLLRAGHKFPANEIVNLVLEPGICSIDDEIDGNCIVRARGLPWQSSDQDIAKFFRGLNVAKGGVALCLSPLGRRNGEALIRFVSQEHRDMALKRHKHHIGNRYIEVYRATGEDFLAIAGGASNEAQAFLSKGAQVIIRMRGLPYDCTAKQVLDFFTNGEKPCNVLDGTEGVLFVKKPDGRATGDAFVLFANESDAPNALARHRESIGQRYIELFRSTTAEVQQVLNRSMDPKTYESNHQQSLITQLPAVQLPLLPQHLITSGTTKNCIRLRGLPYEAQVEHILHFLDDFAKHIIFQGVHMVINAQGQPSGEAFIQMDTEEAARLCAQRKHNQFMVFGKKYRYIEVFQCSGDDMNMVLNGGLHSPLGTHHTHHPGSKPSLLSPGMLAQPPPSTAQTISSHTHAHNQIHAHSHSHVHHALQSQPNVAAAVAALSSQSQHAHLLASAAATANQQAAAANNLSHYLSTNTPSSAAQHPSLTQPGANATVAQNVVSLGGNPQTALQLPSAAVHAHAQAQAAANSQAALVAAFPFNFSALQSSAAAQNAAPSSPALLATPQSHFLTEHNAQAAALAAFPFHFAASLPHSTQTSAANSALIATQQAQFIAQQNFLARQQQAAAAAAAGQPQFLLMPRPYYQPFPLSYMPQQFGGAAGVSAAQAACLPGSLTAATTQTLSAAHAQQVQQSMKRSYENAFQHDAQVASAAKRALTRPPGSVYPFYNPGI